MFQSGRQDPGTIETSGLLTYETDLPKSASPTTNKRPWPQTCRDLDRSSLVDMGVDVVNCLFDSSDLFGLFIGDLALEFFLERHH